MFRTSINKVFGDSTSLDVVKTNFRSFLTTQTAFHKARNPFQYTPPSGSGLGQKVILYVMGIQEQVTSSRFTGSTITFKLPKFEGYLAQVIIECNLSSTSDNTNVQPRLGSRVFKQITLETQRGCMNVDRLIKPDYTNARLDALNQDQSQIDYSTDPNQTFNNNTITCYTPCFFWFSEDASQNLPVASKTEALQIRAIVNDSESEMGLPGVLTDMTFRAICTYYTHIFIPTRSYFIPPEPRLISDVYYEKPLAVALGSTSVTLPITCPYSVFNLSILIRDTNQEMLRPESFTLYSNNEVIASLNRRINFSLDLKKGATESNGEGALNYWFSLSRSRSKNSFVLNLRDLSPLKLVVNFAAAPSSNFSLYVLWEYFTQLVIDDGGAGMFYRPNQY